MKLTNDERLAQIEELLAVQGNMLNDLRDALLDSGVLVPDSAMDKDATGAKA